MRISNALVTRNTIAGMMTNSAKLAESQQRVTSGLKVATMSDDPAAGAAIMQASGSLRAIAQYRSNVGQVGSELDVEDTALDQVGQLLMRAKELAVGQSGANASTASRQAAAQEVKELIAQAVQLGNTKLGDAYVFGGASAAATAPFDITQTGQVPNYVTIPSGQLAPVLPQGARAVEIAAGQTMAGAHDGDALFVQSGVFQSLQDLYAGLTADSPTAITASLTTLDGAFSAVQSFVGDVGARRNRVETVQAGLDAFETNLTTLKSDLSEVDMERAIAEMVSRQTAYQAAMLASSKVMGMSLTDYLR